VNRNIVPFNLAWTPLPIKLEPIPLNVFWSAKYHRDPANQWLRAMMFDTFSEGAPHEPATGGLFISTSACRIHGFGGGILRTGGHSRHRRWRNPRHLTSTQARERSDAPRLNQEGRWI
jgi:hypothetical protein